MPPKTPRRPERPVFWIVAGPNGCGKSSLYNLTSLEGWGGSVWIINPDLLTATIVEQEALAMQVANLAAVQRVEQWLDASIATYQTIGEETVLLDSVDLQLARIRRRVGEGGHGVPAEKVAARRLRSFQQFAWFAAHVDRCFIFNNSFGDPNLAGVMSPGGLVRVGRLPRDFLDVLDAEGLPVV